MVNINYLYNPDITRKNFEKNYFLDKKLGFSIIEGGMILPHKRLIAAKDPRRRCWGAGGLVDNKGEFIQGSSVVLNAGEAYTPSFESIRHSSETVIYLGPFYPVWGHVITDNIRRVWFLQSEIFKKDFKNCPIVYIPWLEGYYTLDRMPDAVRFLEILGVNPSKLQPITQPTKFDKIILPDSSFEWNFTAEYRDTIDRVRHFALKNRTPTSIKKCYFFYGHHQVGEERIAEYFKSKGYAIITHEQRSKSFDEELNLLINAESFASPTGSCGNNSVFLRDGTEAIFIPRDATQITYQIVIDKVHPLNVNYVDSTLSVFNVRHDSFCFIISEQLKRFFGDKWNGYEEGDFRNFLEYVRSPVRLRRKINPIEVQRYGTIFTDFMEQLKKREDLIKACDMPPGWETFRPIINYMTHVHSKGWGDGWTGENQSSNPLDQQLEILAIKINPPESFHKIYYSVYFNDKEDWSAEVQAPEKAGTVGKRKPIYGMRIRFDEAGSKEFDILYRMHKFDDTWTPWAKNGEALYSHGVKLNAIQIKLEPKTQKI